MKRRKKKKMKRERVCCVEGASTKVLVPAGVAAPLRVP